MPSQLVSNSNGAKSSPTGVRGHSLTSHRKRREQEAIEQRAAELQEGHGEFCFSGYVTVTAATEAEVADACAAVVAAAEQSGLELRRLVGAQDVALAYTLPLGRGLR